MVPNSEVGLFEQLDRSHRFRINRHGNRRYFLSDYTIDVMQPRSFYNAFCTVEEALAYFDLSVNALAVRVRDGRLLNPIGGLQDLQQHTLRPNNKRWCEANDFEFVHLMLRTVRYVSRYRFRLTNSDLIWSNMHRLDLVDWTELYKYHQLSRVDAEQRIRTLADYEQDVADGQQIVRSAG
jgi:hypothetical protein